MLLTRFGYHALVVAWLVVLGLIDVIANTALTGAMSEIYFYKVFLDAALVWWTILYIKEDLSGNVLSATSARAQNHPHVDDGISERGHEAVVKVNLGTSEYIYYGFLCLYALGNLYFHHQINAQETGFMSFGTLILSMVDVVIAVIGGVNFYQVASGKLVKLQQRVQQ